MDEGGGGTERDAAGKHSNQLHKQQQHQLLQRLDKQVVASTQGKEKSKNRDSLSERALVAKNAIDLIRRVAFRDLTPTTWELLCQNLDSTALYIKDTEEDRKQTRENTTAATKNISLGESATWATVAAQAAMAKGTAKEQVDSGWRRLRELVIRVENENEREQTRTLLAEQILQKLQSTKHAETSQLVAARRLQNGDILLQAATVGSREQLERNTGWEKQLFGSAKVLRQTFPVLMHGVRLDAVPEGQEQEVAARIMRQNEKYHPRIEIS